MVARVYSLDTRPRACQRRFKRISTVLPFSPCHSLPELQETRKRKRNREDKKKKVSWSFEKYRQTKRTETRPASKITNFDFCLVYRFYLFTITLNLIFMVICYLYRKTLKYSQRLTSPSDRALAYSTSAYDHVASTVGYLLVLTSRILCNIRLLR